MPSSYSTNLGFELPASGEQSGTWGTTTNTNVGTLIEQAISGYVTQAITDGADTTITIPNGASGVGRNMYLELTGALTGARNLIVPSNKKLYFVYNNTTGGFAVTVKVSGQTGVSVPNGSRLILVSNGTDIVNAVSYGTSTAVGANPSGSLGLTAVNGVATTFMRSDASPALSQAITPTWTGAHTFSAAVTLNGAVSGTGVNNLFASPPPVGSTSPGSGAFTTLAASSTVSGSGFSLLFASPPTLGSTTPAGARFTYAHTSPVIVTFSATAMDIDCSLSNVFRTTFTANVTTAPTLSNLKDGQTINWYITQDATGSRTMTWPTSFKWPGGTAGVLTTTANAVDMLVATYIAATGFWYCTLNKAFS